MNFAAVLDEKDREALVKLPGFDLESAKVAFQEHIKHVDDLVTKAKELKVETEENNQLAVGMVTTSKKLAKAIEQKKTELTKEPREFVTDVGNFCKTFTSKLKTIEDILGQKITEYRKIQEQKRREAEALARKETEKLQVKLNKNADKKGIEAPQVLAPIIPKEAPVTRTETGSAYARKVWTYQVLDLKLLPEKYFDQLWELVRNKEIPAVNKSIMADINQGMREIPGLRIYEEEKTSFRIA
jgi:hypothetical protein